MKLNQISIFLENRSGRLAEVTNILGKADINIRALSLADTSDFGILRLIVNDPDKAVAILKENHFTVNETEVLAIEVDDKPGGLSKILDILEQSELNVEYMYAFVEKETDKAILVYRFDETDKAVSVLQGKGIRILTGEEVYSL